MKVKTKLDGATMKAKVVTVFVGVRKRKRLEKKCWKGYEGEAGARLGGGGYQNDGEVGKCHQYWGNG